ncbi:carbohydrate ABC transporter substrate-binding protein [Blastococcus sp. MG754426]|uniref:ABC transporter substrate-binding protein n=1 Tax=unclassified Blastococcus TaxID=2619396 RepID=UPI001EF0B409|nr:MULTISPECIES: ABC transporter substrate-binding protein [unclassified Blastococcus]MCF6510063.1 carbohydrate ABC transporter substrate-binding protein [Blastococcus sp. MG754426]MCF6514440.1 carbohydrate ABC transporter substrate-binding protein [Blastococcus sp. MG754427]MCF6737654.1 carbohydrate ABC transporter substrate-binding protein [Blastococcus sp. KM273129]
MSKRARGRGAAALAGGLGLTLLLTGCGADEIDGGGNGGGAAAADTEIDCAPYEEFGDLEGETVTVYTSITDPEDQPHIDSYVPFEECTGVDVQYEGSREFEAQLVVRVQSGNAPDIAYIPQPGLLATLVGTGAVVPAPQQVESNTDEYWDESWKEYGSVDGTFYAAPLGANAKSFVWYSPSMFEEAGYEIPQTWDEMIALSEEIAATGAKPWCAGIGSGEATGWPATDWLEDVVLRTAGPEVYDQWVNHEIPFDDPQIVEALNTVGEILKNPEFVNGGLGEVQSIATTEFGDAGLPILDGNCWLHRQASFYQANWPDGTEVGEDGDVFAFPLPPIGDAGTPPVLGGGEFTAAFNDDPATQAFQTYLSSPEWANIKAQVSGPGWVSANTGLEIDNLVSPIDQLSAELFQDPEAVFRFDGSDLMPGEIGAGELWTQLTEWIASDKSSEAALTAVENAWPES